MLHRWLALLPLCLAHPVRAGDVNVRATEPPVEGSANLPDTEDTFTLVVHGPWSQPATRSNDRAKPAAESAQSKGDQQRGRPSYRRASYLRYVQWAEAQFALPKGLLDALVWRESRYNPLAVSKAGAAGLGQLMPGTARELGVFNRFDPLANLVGSARYLRQLLDRFGMVHLALAAYNAGPSAVERAGGIPRNSETPAYVRDILAYWRTGNEF